MVNWLMDPQIGWKDSSAAVGKRKPFSRVLFDMQVNETDYLS